MIGPIISVTQLGLAWLDGNMGEGCVPPTGQVRVGRRGAGRPDSYVGERKSRHFGYIASST